MQDALQKMVSQNAEATVISTALKHPEFTLHSEMLKPGYFFNVENGCWLWAINELYKKGITNIDALNLSNMIESNTSVSKTMKSKNITDISKYIELSSLAARDTVEEYMVAVKEVLTMAYKRDLYKTLTKLTRECTNEDINLNTLEKDVNDEINRVTEKYIIEDDMGLFGEVVDELWGQIVNERNSDGSYGVPTIFPGLTKRGLVHEPGEMILLYAKRKVGKSMILLNETMNKLKNGMAVIYHDTEMSDKLFMIRMLSHYAGVPVDKIKSGKVTSAEAKKIQEGLEWIKKQRFKHIYAPRFNDIEIYNQYKIFMYKYGSDVLGVYDYFKADGTTSSDNYNQLGIRADFMKNEIAGELGIPVLAAAQLNRGDQIADSFRLEMIASAGITYRPKTPQEIADYGGLDAGNYLLHLDFARSAEPMGDNEFLHVSVDGNKMRAMQAIKQPPAPELPYE